MGEKEGPPGKVIHRDDKHHEYAEPVIHLINAYDREVRQEEHDGAVYHLYDDRRKSRRNVGEPEFYERPVEGK